MTQTETDNLARQLMSDHDLTQQGWRIGKPIRARRLYGQCRSRDRQIRLNYAFADLASDEEVRDLILHEIAHALLAGRPSPHKRSRSHNAEFYAECRRIGARPERCYRGGICLPAPRPAPRPVTRPRKGPQPAHLRRHQLAQVIARREQRLAELDRRDEDGREWAAQQRRLLNDPAHLLAHVCRALGRGDDQAPGVARAYEAANGYSFYAYDDAIKMRTPDGHTIYLDVRAHPKTQVVINDGPDWHDQQERARINAELAHARRELARLEAATSAAA